MNEATTESMKYKIKQNNMADLAAYQEALRTKPKLRFLFFELTDKCNLNCVHCGSRCTGTNNTFLDYNIVNKTMRAVKDKYGTRDIMICITGGEPLLHPAIFDVIRDAHDMGFPVGITTNGTLIDNISAKRLAASGLDTISVSIDGIGEVHDSFRVAKGSFDRAVAGIHALKKAGIEPEAITVVHKKNYVQLEKIYEFLKKEDIYAWRLINIEPIGRAKANQELLLEPDQMKGLFQYIREKRFDVDNDMLVNFGCSHFAGFEFENEIRDFYFQCGAGTMIASVMANGDIGACLDIERRKDLVQGNVYHDEFVNVWENRFEVFRKDRTKQSSKCSNCKYAKVCMGDSVHTWDFDANEPGLCVMGMIEDAYKKHLEERSKK